MRAVFEIWSEERERKMYVRDKKNYVHANKKTEKEQKLQGQWYRELKKQLGMGSLTLSLDKEAKEGKSRVLCNSQRMEENGKASRKNGAKNGGG